MSPGIDLRVEAEQHRVSMPEVALEAEPRRLVESTWRGRMVNEHASARVFAQLLGQGMKASLPAYMQQELLTFAQEELQHARLCAGVLASMDAEAVGVLEALPDVPSHGDTSPEEAFLRNIISVCCLSETVATALIARERERLADGSPLEPVLRAILADEVGHARFGWKYLELTERSEETNASLDRYLPLAFGHLEVHELAHLSPHTASPEAQLYGACDGAEARTLFYKCVEEVIIPRLEQHGLQATQAWSDRRKAAPS